MRAQKKLKRALQLARANAVYLFEMYLLCSVGAINEEKGWEVTS